MSAVADKFEDFQKMGVDVLSMSVDSVFVHKMWNDNELSKMVDGGVPFPMLSDGGGKVGTVYGVTMRTPGWKPGAGSSSIPMAWSRDTKS